MTTEIRNILDQLLINNEKSLIDTILEYAACECHECIEITTNKITCETCDIYLCNECKSDYYTCGICEDEYCPDCESYTKCDECEINMCECCRDDHLLYCESCDGTYCIGRQNECSVGFYVLETPGHNTITYYNCGHCMADKKIN